ncbi:MAG: hypothetical protein Q9178_004857 [Gyalolechia marmorata]
MEVELGESEMLLGTVDTCPDGASPQIKAASKYVAPSDSSSTSPGHETAGNAPIESSNPSKYASRRRAADPETIRKVEEVVHQIVRSLQQEDNNLSIALRTRKRPGNSPPASKSQSLGHDQYKLSFPGKTPEEAWRFSTAELTETAKGYPDVSTRVFLRLLSISSHPLPSIYALVDFDPDGISIMSTYKHGSLTLSHENANLRCPIIRWLGVKSGDLDFRESTTGPSGAGEEDIKGLLWLTKRDRKKAVKMLGQEICEEYGVEQEWRRELQVMLMLNLKVEMEILSQRKGGVEGWVEDKLCEEMS